VSTIRKREWTSHGQPRSAWVVDYADQHGKRRLKTFATKREAEAWRATALHEVSQGTHTPSSTSVTVIRAWELWLNHCEGLERGTLKQRREHLRLHVTPFIGWEKLASLTAPRIFAFDDQLRSAGRSVAMRRKVLSTFKTMLAFAQGRGLVAQNVARGVRIAGENRDAQGPLREGVDYPSRGELKALMDAVTGRWRPFLLTAIFSGMRASELRGLGWEHVDLAAGIIHVRQRADLWKKIGPPKSRAGKRDIPVPPIVLNALKAWRPQCPAGELKLVFPTKTGRVESMSNLTARFWHPLQIRCELTKSDGSARYGFHSLRHAAASLFIAHLGWPPKRVQTVMGHASITMTFDHYGHLFSDPEGDREAMKRVEAALAV
jgi:integrase